MLHQKKPRRQRGFLRRAKVNMDMVMYFLGVTVPELRVLAKKYRILSFSDVEDLLKSKYHEERLLALFILVLQFNNGDVSEQKDICDFYLANIKYVNNWDLVDSSAHQILGELLVSGHAEFSSASTKILKKFQDDNSNVLIKFAQSESLWERRIAIMVTFAFIKRGVSNETFRISEMLLSDTHDLIHKAVGWMLREVGRRIGQDEEEKFLKKNYKKMPRTMLRYAIEKFQPDLRKAYLLGTV